LSVDLHLHSNVSDGADTPEQVMELAASAGLSHAALMDHDTLDGIDRARKAADRLGLGFIPGIELSVDHGSTKIHMLVYFLEPGRGPLQSELSDLRRGRNVRNEQIVERLCELGYEITLDEVQRHAKGPSVGRPHIADALVEKGYIESRDEAFADLLHDGGAAYVERARLTAADAIRLARDAQAVPVIAHPVTMNLTRDGYASTFIELTDLGLGGIEAHHPMHDLALRAHLTELAAHLGIAATGGSDYHGATKRAYRVGVGKGDLRVPESAVEQLHHQRDR
jgi:predicted metal-dependent phosphoesterase TrpH